ncbi:MAG TPA: PrsW family glutamic-type intramembrane protease [Acidimicrobiales bacterium]|nr:PrsW family glutamic-type intramembrane protease [Acidimicrobiales bacterium]
MAPDRDAYPDRLVDEPALAWLDGTLAAPDDAWAPAAPWRQGAAAIAAALAAGPFAVVSALVLNSTTAPGFGALALIVVIGPLIEELVKGAAAIHLVERRPQLVASGWVLVFVGLVSGLVFAALENVWYLAVLIDEPSRELVRWRWTFGPLVHGTGSVLVGIGAARAWRAARARRSWPEFATIRPWIVAAAILHGTANAASLVLSALGVIE